jgi:hypothetical protein
MQVKPVANSFQRTDVTAAVGVNGLVAAGALSGGVIVPGLAYLYLVADGQALRYTDDGTTPTTTVGFYLPVGQGVYIYPGQFANFKVISTAASGFADCAAYRQ